MERQTVIVNFKHYGNATGHNSVALANSLGSAEVPENISVLYSVGIADLALFGGDLKSHVISQHVDGISYGAYTGKVSIEFLKEIGINGSLLNHSENRISGTAIEETVRKSRKLGFGITLCVESEDEARKYAALEPEYIAYEPPELIGGDISVSTSRPEIIERVVRAAGRHGVRVLVGAGVKRNVDYVKSLELGACGVLVASGIVMADDPVNSLNSLINSQSP